MAGRLEVTRGQIWLCRFAPPDKRRPVVVLSRASALRYLRPAIVAPISSTIHGVVTEVLIGEEHGMKGPSVVKLDLVQTVRQEELVKYVATLPPEIVARVCGALSIATGCSG